MRSAVGGVATRGCWRQRWWLAVLVAAVLLTGCLGHTTGATNVTQTSATLNYVGSCGSGEHCSWYAQYRGVGTSTWTQVPATPKGPVTGPTSTIPLSEPANGLIPGAKYEYQACGNSQPGNGFICVGPSGTTSSTSTFTASTALQNTYAPTVSPDNDPYNWEHQIVLTANPGTWSGTAPISYAYQWQMWNGNDPTVSGFSCQNAVGDGGGSTNTTFTPGSSDVFLYPRVAVTATDSASPPATVTTYSLPTHQLVVLLLLATGHDLMCQPAGTPTGTIEYLHPGGFFFPAS
jgi:hypothetical protein